MCLLKITGHRQTSGDQDIKINNSPREKNLKIKRKIPQTKIPPLSVKNQYVRTP